jgi:hypothetical protein
VRDKPGGKELSICLHFKGVMAEGEQ